MARGYPDFFGFSVFPWYGAVRQDQAIVGVGAGATEIIIALTGKRVIYNATISLTGIATHATDVIDLYTDGLLITKVVWVAHAIRFQAVAVPTEAIMTRMDEEAFIYSLHFNGVFSVGTRVEIQYTNNGAALVNVLGDFVNAIIQ